MNFTIKYYKKNDRVPPYFVILKKDGYKSLSKTQKPHIFCDRMYTACNIINDYENNKKYIKLIPKKDSHNQIKKWFESQWFNIEAFDICNKIISPN